MKINKNSILIPLALIMISAGTFVKLFATLPNFINGFLKGMALIILMFCVIRSFKTNNQQ